jgi:iron(III) transport system substrate-binding protein
MRANKPRSLIRCLISSLSLTSLLVYANIARGADPELIEQAKKEGEVVLYTTMPVVEFQIFNQALKEKYPFLNVRHVRISSASQVARVMLEHKSGKTQADVLGNSVTALSYLKSQGVVEPYESPETKHLLKGTMDPEGYWSGITTDFLITALNTNLISAEKAPKNFDDYLNPVFKNQFGVNRGVAEGLIGMMEVWGAEKGLAYMRRLGQQGLRPVEGFAHMANLLAAGEYPLAIYMQVSKIDAMRKKGAPVAWLPTSPALATVSAVSKTRNSPDPAAAKLLIDFYLSAEGQQALARAGKIPLRRGVKSPSPDIDELLEGGNFHVVKAEGDYSRYMKLYNEILGIR